MMAMQEDFAMAPSMSSMQGELGMGACMAPAMGSAMAPAMGAAMAEV